MPDPFDDIDRRLRLYATARAALYAALGYSCGLIALDYARTSGTPPAYVAVVVTVVMVATWRWTTGTFAATWLGVAGLLTSLVADATGREGAMLALVVASAASWAWSRRA